MAKMSRLHWPVTALPFAVLAVAAPVVADEAPFADDQPLAAAALLSDMVASVDIDADGDLDLVGHGDEHVRWVERGASGDWTVRSIYQYPAGTIVYDAAVGDLNGDGDLDVVAWRENDEEDIYLDWFENDGTPANGAWTKRNAWWSDAGPGTEHRPLSVVVGDVDGDGDLDLAAGYWEELFSDPGGNGRINWWENDGGDPPTWNDHTIQDWWGRRWPRALAMGDLDRDGDLDLAGAMAYDGYETGTLYWWSNDGTPANGAWARTALNPAISGPDPDSVDLGDFDRDGDLDVVAKDYLGLLELYENRIDDGGSWSLVLSWSVSGREVRYADLDGDGWLDLLLTIPNTWIENLAGSYTPESIHDLSGSASGSGVAADLDGDGDADIAFAWGTVYWLENRTIHRSAFVRDERVANELIDGAFDVAVGDIDGDGDLDLVSAAEANDHVYLHRNSGTPGDDSLWSLTTLTSAVNGPRAVALGDLDDDADLDVAVASYNDNTVSWLENDGTAANWTKRVISAGAGGANDVALGDFDRDGDLDIACAQYLDDEFSWYRNDGASPPSFTPLFVDPLPFVGPRALAVGDLDGDGDLDLATASEDADALFWYENDGAPGENWPRHRFDGGESDAPKDVALADLDADGDLDLLVAAYVGDAAFWYENDGSPSGWTARMITTCNGARSVAAGDFDRDGDDDVLVACYDEDRVLLQANNGASPPDLSQTVSTYLGADGARTALAADLDRDGNLDGVVAQGGDDQIAWYENGGGQFRVYGTSIVDDPLRPDSVAGLFRADVSHRGRAGDGSIELASVAVRLEEAAGDPLSPIQAIDLIDDVLVHGDDGDGVFEVLVDPLLAAASAAGIDGDGVVRVALADLLPGAEIPAASQGTFFVALDLANQFGASAPATLRATLLTYDDSVCEADDREYQIPLDLQWRANLSTATVSVIGGLFSDGFESGDTSEWSSVFP